jgi:4'-phosphopantetheinyl transferase
MIKILFSRLDHPMPTDAWVQLKLSSLPIQVQQSINRYVQPTDKLLRLAGKLLLQEMIKELAIAKVSLLNELSRHEKGKPHLKGHVFFSLSYTKDMAICAASLEAEMGIDIEKIIFIDKHLYKDYFTQQEWISIGSSKEEMVTFYDYWTRKEAIVKLQGQGLESALSELDTISNEVEIGGNHFYLQKIQVLPGYSCHLATGLPGQKIAIGESNILFQ